MQLRAGAHGRGPSGRRGDDLGSARHSCGALGRRRAAAGHEIAARVGVAARRGAAAAERARGPGHAPGHAQLVPPHRVRRAGRPGQRGVLVRRSGPPRRRRELAVPWPARGAIAPRVSCARVRGAAARGGEEGEEGEGGGEEGEEGEGGNEDGQHVHEPEVQLHLELVCVLAIFFLGDFFDLELHDGARRDDHNF